MQVFESCFILTLFGFFFLSQEISFVLLNVDEMTRLNMIFLFRVKLVRLIVQQFMNTEYALNWHFGHAEIVLLSLLF